MTKDIDNDEILEEVLQRLIAQNNDQGMQLVAMAAVNSLLMREICLLKGQPDLEMMRLEGEILSLGQSISGHFRPPDQSPAMTTEPITRTLNSILEMAMDSLGEKLKTGSGS